MYAPVVDVHWVTVKQLAYLEPTLVEVVACMIGDLLNDALQETDATPSVFPSRRRKAMLMGHVQVALANGLRGDNPFSDACLIAMDYGREKIIKDDWKSIFNDDELDYVLKQMLHLDTSTANAKRPMPDDGRRLPWWRRPTHRLPTPFPRCARPG